MELTAVIELGENILATETELENLRTKAKAAGVAKIDGQPHGQATTSRVESLTVKIVDTERKLDNLREEYKATLHNLSREIDQRVKGRAATVLDFYYIMRLPFAEIASLLGLSVPRISQLHRQGRTEFYRQ